MNPLIPDPGLLFWMVLSFGVVFFLLAKFGFPVIVKAINERKEFIEMSLLSAKQANEKLASIQTEGEKLLADAKAQQKDIIASAMQEKKQIVLQFLKEQGFILDDKQVEDSISYLVEEAVKQLNIEQNEHT